MHINQRIRVRLFPNEGFEELLKKVSNIFSLVYSLTSKVRKLIDLFEYIGVFILGGRPDIHRLSSLIIGPIITCVEYEQIHRKRKVHNSNKYDASSSK